MNRDNRVAIEAGLMLDASTKAYYLTQCALDNEDIYCLETNCEFIIWIPMFTTSYSLTYNKPRVLKWGLSKGYKIADADLHYALVHEYFHLLDLIHQHGRGRSIGWHTDP